MADKKCPHCGLWSKSSAKLCDCGYNFENELLDTFKATQIRRGISLALRSLLLSIFGILTSPWPFLEYDLTAMHKTIGNDLYNTLLYGSFLLSLVSSLFGLMAGIKALARKEALWPVALVGISLATVALLAVWYMGSLMLIALFS